MTTRRTKVPVASAWPTATSRANCVSGRSRRPASRTVRATSYTGDQGQACIDAGLPSSSSARRTFPSRTAASSRACRARVCRGSGSSRQSRASLLGLAVGSEPSRHLRRGQAPHVEAWLSGTGQPHRPGASRPRRLPDVHPESLPDLEVLLERVQPGHHQLVQLVAPVRGLQEREHGRHSAVSCRHHALNGSEPGRLPLRRTPCCQHRAECDCGVGAHLCGGMRQRPEVVARIVLDEDPRGQRHRQLYVISQVVRRVVRRAATARQPGLDLHEAGPGLLEGDRWEVAHRDRRGAVVPVDQCLTEHLQDEGVARVLDLFRERLLGRERAGDD